MAWVQDVALYVVFLAVVGWLVYLVRGMVQESRRRDRTREALPWWRVPVAGSALGLPVPRRRGGDVTAGAVVVSWVSVVLAAAIVVLGFSCFRR